VVRGPKGLKFSEIGCRPPGVGVWDLYCAANEFDLYAAWAHAIVHEKVPFQTVAQVRGRHDRAAARPRRRDQPLRGLRPDPARFGEWILDSHLPPPGTATQGVEGGYMANAYVRMRHPDYDTLRSPPLCHGGTCAMRLAVTTQ
jgi:hypothetical protein